jgi:hypothetical protein
LLFYVPLSPRRVHAALKNRSKRSSKLHKTYVTRDARTAQKARTRRRIHTSIMTAWLYTNRKGGAVVVRESEDRIRGAVVSGQRRRRAKVPNSAGNVYLVSVWRKVIRSLRSLFFLRPPKAILVPGMYFLGFSRYSNYTELACYVYQLNGVTYQ